MCLFMNEEYRRWLRSAAIKEAVVTALDQLYLQMEDPLTAAGNLAGLAAGATLGELGSVEEVVAHLMRGEQISHMTIKVRLLCILLLLRLPRVDPLRPAWTADPALAKAAVLTSDTVRSTLISSVANLQCRDGVELA